MIERAATIRDVARHANVSVASVSRALNGHDNVHPETRERVMRAAAELHYVPNAAARSLSSSLTNTIGVVVPDLHGEFFSELIRGMDAAAGELGYLLLLSTMHADPALAGQALTAMRGRVDGLIVMAPQLPRETIDALMPPTLPGVELICDATGKRPAIGIDNRDGAAQATRHLLATGRRAIAHIMGPPENFDVRERKAGFMAAMAEAGVAPVAMAVGDFREEGGARAVEELLAPGQPPIDAIFAANDMMALGALQALRTRGVRVPDDIAVIGFDDIPLARHLGLSTMRLNVDQIGRSAVNRLVAMLTTGRIEAEIINQRPELIIRATTGE